MRWLDFFIIIGVCLLVVAVSVRAEDDAGGEDDEFHCTLGAVGLGFMLAVLLIGFVQAGWFGPVRSRVFLRFHLLVSVLLAVYLSLVFVFGWLRAGSVWIPNVHGIVGVLVPVVAWVAVGLSPCVVGKRIGWKRAGLLHGAVGIVLLLVIVVQVLIGYFVIGG